MKTAAMARWALATAAGLVVLLVAAPAASAAPLLPTSDPFYTYSGSLKGIAPGTVLRSRAATFDEVAVPVPISTTQVLYRTTGELGQPTATVATVMRPLLATGATKLISYQMAYDGMGSECDPSYAIQGGQPTEETNPLEQQLILGLLAEGYTVVTADYEGEKLDFTAGQEAGYGTLDAIRATESQLKLSASTPVGMIGYSGGSIATDFAAELAPTYAPALHIVGAAMGGLPVDYAHNLTYINGSSGWAGAIPASLVGLARAFHIDLNQYLSPYGQQVVKSIGDSCLATSLSDYPGLTYQKLFKSQYEGLVTAAVEGHSSTPGLAKFAWLIKDFNHLIMGTAGTPREPLFIGVGNADGTGDDVMIAADVEALAHEYCTRGLSVQFTEYKGENHETAALSFLPPAEEFIEGLLGGGTVANGCSSIGVGNSLAPLPLPPSTPKLRIHYLGTRRHHHGVWLQLWTSTGTLKHLVLKLHRAGKVVDTIRIASVSTHGKVLVLRVKHKLPPAGRYTIAVSQSGQTLIKRKERIRT